MAGLDEITVANLPCEVTDDEAEAARRTVLRHARDWPDALAIMQALGLRREDPR
jgi:hypothetical protein